MTSRTGATCPSSPRTVSAYSRCPALSWLPGTTQRCQPGWGTLRISCHLVHCVNTAKEFIVLSILVWRCLQQARRLPNYSDLLPVYQIYSVFLPFFCFLVVRNTQNTFTRLCYYDRSLLIPRLMSRSEDSFCSSESIRTLLFSSSMDVVASKRTCGDMDNSQLEQPDGSHVCIMTDMGLHGFMRGGI